MGGHCVSAGGAADMHGVRSFSWARDLLPPGVRTGRHTRTLRGDGLRKMHRSRRHGSAARALNGSPHSSSNECQGSATLWHTVGLVAFAKPSAARFIAQSHDNVGAYIARRCIHRSAA